MIVRQNGWGFWVKQRTPSWLNGWYKQDLKHGKTALQKHLASVVKEAIQKELYYLPSGAGHDAMVMSEITDIGMLFIRFEKGIGHNPRKNILASDAEIALTCLIKIIRKLSKGFE